MHSKIINPKLEDQNYLSIVGSLKKKIKIVKIRTNSRELHTGTRCWITPKTPWEQRLCQFYNTKKEDDGKHFLLDFSSYTYIRSHFQAICNTMDLHNILNHENKRELRKLIFLSF
jgi:hypothetical protein